MMHLFTKNALTLTTFVIFGLSACSAQAQTITFTGLQNLEAVNNYYNGGSGGSGSTGGPNDGISFSTNGLAIISSAAGGTGNFPAAQGTILFFVTGASSELNDASGFNTGFSFDYAASQPGSVAVYSGLNATGTLLASLALSSTPNPYQVFVPIGVSFTGTAHSVSFIGAANYIGFDDITVNSASVGGSPTPEPSPFAVFGIAGLFLTGMLFKARKRHSSVTV